MKNPSAAENSGEALPKIAFRSDGRQFKATIKHPIDERANDRCAVQRFAGLFSNDVDGTVKFDDLSVE